MLTLITSINRQLLPANSNTQPITFLKMEPKLPNYTYTFYPIYRETNIRITNYLKTSSNSKHTPQRPWKRRKILNGRSDFLKRSGNTIFSRLFTNHSTALSALWFPKKHFVAAFRDVHAHSSSSFSFSSNVWFFINGRICGPIYLLQLYVT